MKPQKDENAFLHFCPATGWAENLYFSTCSANMCILKVDMKKDKKKEQKKLNGTLDDGQTANCV